MSDKPLTDVTFSSFELQPALLAGLEGAGFTRCTPIQALTLPVALPGGDVAGQAQTGTGKTLAFLVAVANRLLTRPALADRKPEDPRALILAPTRELAIQIHKDAMKFAADTGLRFALVYGGVDYDKQRELLQQGVDVIIATPGRLIDYVKQHKVVSLHACEICVLDEADRMFDLGFIKDIRFLLRRMPERTTRQTLLFSATLSHRVLELAYEHMNEPQKLVVETESITADRVRQRIAAEPVGGVEGRGPAHDLVRSHPGDVGQLAIVGDVLIGAQLKVIVIDELGRQVTPKLAEKLFGGEHLPAHGLLGPLQVAHDGAALGLDLALLQQPHQGQHAERKKNHRNVRRGPVPAHWAAANGGGFGHRGSSEKGEGKASPARAATNADAYAASSALSEHRPRARRQMLHCDSQARPPPRSFGVTLMQPRPAAPPPLIQAASTQPAPFALSLSTGVARGVARAEPHGRGLTRVGFPPIFPHHTCP